MTSFSALPLHSQTRPNLRHQTLRIPRTIPPTLPTGELSAHELSLTRSFPHEIQLSPANPSTKTTRPGAGNLLVPQSSQDTTHLTPLAIGANNPLLCTARLLPSDIRGRWPLMGYGGTVSGLCRTWRAIVSHALSRVAVHGAGVKNIGSSCVRGLAFVVLLSLVARLATSGRLLQKAMYPVNAPYLCKRTPRLPWFDCELRFNSIYSLLCCCISSLCELVGAEDQTA